MAALETALAATLDDLLPAELMADVETTLTRAYAALAATKEERLRSVETAIRGDPEASEKPEG